MKKKLLFLVALSALALKVYSQTVNQVTIIPSNPSSTDTIMVIADFSYNGNCAFGMVYSYSFLVDSTITILPTYCGYGDTSSCNSVDTFLIGPYPQGNYTVMIEFHQGSVCPASGFDATLTSYDTSVVIDSTTGIIPVNSNQPLSISPNPFLESATLLFENKENKLVVLKIYDTMGKLSETVETSGKEILIQRKNNPPGIYFFRLEKPGNNYTGKLVIQ